MEYYEADGAAMANGVDIDMLDEYYPNDATELDNVAIETMVSEFRQLEELYPPQQNQTVEPQYHEDTHVTKLRQDLSSIYWALKWSNDHIDALRNNVEECKIAQRMGESHKSLRPKFDDLITAYRKIEQDTLEMRRWIESSISSIAQLEQAGGDTGELTKLKKACQDLIQQVNESLYAAVKDGILITQSPKPVVSRSPKADARSTKDSRLKIELEITVSCGLLSGFFKDGMQVEVFLLTDHQAQLWETNHNEFQQAGPLRNHMAPLMADAFGSLTAVFPDLRIQPLPKAVSNLPSEMHRFLFRIKSSLDNIYSPYSVTSVPFAVVSNAAKQGMAKEASVFWEVLIATRPNQDGSKESAPWPHVFKMLNFWIKRMAGVSRGLEEHEAFIKEMLFKTANPANENVTNQMLTKEPLAAGNGTFWEFIFNITAYLKKFPQDWENKLLYGFVDSETAATWVLGSSKPSVVFRFSASSPGRIVAVYVNPNNPLEVEQIMLPNKEKSLAETVKSIINLEKIEAIAPTGSSISDLDKYNEPDTDRQARDNPYLVRFDIFKRQ